MEYMLEHVNPLDDGGELFPLFSDRVQRAAHLGCGLLACPGFLF
jgi:hypothetical protein